MKKLISLFLVSAVLSGCTIVGINPEEKKAEISNPTKQPEISPTAILTPIIPEGKVVFDKDEEVINKEINELKIEEDFSKFLKF
jgi:hypothetical protein